MKGGLANWKHVRHIEGKIDKDNLTKLCKLIAEWVKWKFGQREKIF